MADFKIKKDLHPNYLRSVLMYDSLNGEFRWKYREDVPNNINGRVAGKVAGTVTPNGYVAITINKRIYQAHRLAWLFVNGEWPDDEIDHINGDPGNNRIDNLRLATRQENQRNVGLRKNNTTGVPGVSWHTASGKFRAAIRTGGKRLHLGLFDTLEEAAAARRAAEIKYYGNFRRVAA
jgi:hypothetical protein